ncbi:MAG: glycosyltransferase [Isosphaeraceae bacterium]
MKLLLVARGSTILSPEGDMAQPFGTYRDDIRSALGLDVVRVDALTLEAVEAAVDHEPADLVVLMISWQEHRANVEATVQSLTSRHPGTKFVFLDYFAPASSPFFGVLPFVDRYIKRQVLRDRTLYEVDLAGGIPLTDYLQNTLGYDLEGWHFGTKLDPAHTDKLVSGWNLGVTERNRNLLRMTRRFGVPWDLRPIALHRRIAARVPGPDEWYKHYRSLGLAHIEPIAKRYRATGTGIVTRRRYLAEMALSRVVFSPFGWGELCFRDFEAVCCGALLLKPSMNHLETSPDIFVENETYVPVRWDYADLVEKCEHYLSHPDESKRIVDNATAVMTRYFDQNGFLHDLKRCLALDEPHPARHSASGRPLPQETAGR